ncbi:response regulator [Legionella jamestowniensis]|uniref:response regulator n=1 Tax=Legionella jamestowniensis TaxID=455 RepID=UPI0008E7F581|nr:response regulator [Legionella jamestowniensis]SFM07720.1 Signal transduction histidine kinase [Legionella jamestowniensis DSM 19215]
MREKEDPRLIKLEEEIASLKKKLLEEQQKARFLDELIALLPGHVYWLNINNEFLGCNNLQAKSANLASRKEIIGKTNFDMPWKDQAAQLNQVNNLAMQSGLTQIQEESIDTPEGYKTYLSHKEPLRDESNQIVGVLGVSLDITEMKELEAKLRESKELAEAANKAKSEFLDNMRHDIRTPLTGIVGFADLLKAEADNPLVVEYAENLVASSHALLDLLDEVLEAIRVSSGEIPKLKKKFNIRQSLANVIALNRSRAAQKNLLLSLDVDESIPPYVLGDKVRIHRVALELIANALNFTDSGFVKLSVVLAKRDEGRLVVKLIVEDSGIGIPKDKQQEIYIQFKRLTPSYQGIYKGAGLGLTVVKQFIDELEGEIYVESESRKGTRFTCVLPLKEPLLDDDLGMEDEFDNQLDCQYETTYAQEIKPPVLEKKNHCCVLVVEDNDIAQTIASSLLKKLDCDVDIASTGKEAIDLWKANNYALILMDIGLPDMNGYEVTHIIRVQETTQKAHTPIIALTAHAGEENKKRCIDAGMNAVIAKPLTLKQCGDILDSFVPNRHKPEEPPAQDPDKKDLFDLSAFPILDINEGVSTTGSESLLAEMLTLMINDSLPYDLALMKEAREKMDWDKTQQIAHKIKGGAVYVGTVKIKMACQYLETYWKSGQHEFLEPLYEQTLAVIDESIQEINDWLKSNEPNKCLNKDQ